MLSSGMNSKWTRKGPRTVQNEKGQIVTLVGFLTGIFKDPKKGKLSFPVEPLYDDFDILLDLRDLNDLKRLWKTTPLTSMEKEEVAALICEGIETLELKYKTEPLVG